jgi:hypothetical protein
MGKVSDKTFYPFTASLTVIVLLLEQGDYYDHVERSSLSWTSHDEPESGSIKPFG